MSEGRIVAILRGLDPERVKPVAGVLLRSGIDVVEVTLDSPAALESIEHLSTTGQVVGAGTVMSVSEAEAAVTAGAAFLVAPHTDPAVVDWAVEHGHPMIPGCFTATEAMTAWNAGASAVKVFPASVGGAGLIKAFKGPFGTLPLIPTGGITAANAREYLAAGAVAVGLGGWLTGSPDLEVVAERAAAAVQSCRS
jgi:2-dehydro-3-deoxyphosphogluconate aldolase/(4S)-4-hydroxy-2-oxoglutarate aldolase